ncbi:MAG: hypothetical protein AAFZ58_15120 [Pseudomonadota bacterium]
MQAPRASTVKLTSLGVILCGIGLVEPAHAAPLFEDEASLSAVMAVPLAQAYRQRKQDERFYVQGHWSYNDASGNKIRLPLQVRTRGNFRRLNCRQPPLQLNFRKSTLPGTLLAKQDKLKLVGPCSNSDSARQRVLVEEFAYRIHEIVAGDAAFATRRIDLAYVDTDKKYKPREDQTFVIEPIDGLAKRLGGKEFKGTKTRHSTLDAERAVLVEVFQYMIGNTDFSMVASPPYDDKCCHNVKLIEVEGSGRGLVPVPYDFDFSGIVDAPYASPSDKIPIRSVTKRYYMGVCRKDGLIEQAVAHIRSKRADIYAALDATDGLNERYANKTRKYLDEFFAIADDPAQVERRLVKRCRG